MVYSEQDIATVLHMATKGSDAYLTRLVQWLGGFAQVVRTPLVRWPKRQANSVADRLQAAAHRLAVGRLTDGEARALERIQTLAIEVIPLGGPRYPTLLQSIADPPPVLYRRGLWLDLDTPQIAMVGARSASIQAQQIARAFAADLARAGMVITSGLALGVDACAHEGAMQAGHTIAVLAHGIDQVYPRRHAYLAEKIQEQGCLLAEQPFGEPPSKRTFPKRNRVVSGLSVGVVVIEAARQSGSLVTAKHAVDQNREVWAVPWSPLHQGGLGGLDLLSDGAVLLRSIDDVWLTLGQTDFVCRLGMDPKGPPTQARLLTTAQQILIDLMGDTVCTTSDLIQESGFSRQRIQQELVELELMGHIESAPEGYRRV